MGDDMEAHNCYFQMLIVFSLCNPYSNMEKLGQIFPVWLIRLLLSFLLNFIKKEILNVALNRHLFVVMKSSTSKESKIDAKIKT